MKYENYDFVVVGFSGGKDSIACILHLLESGCDPSKIELWHHDVDGREGSKLMDWPFMRDYCQELALHWDLPLYFSWLKGGFEGEMTKLNRLSQPHAIETPDGLRVFARSGEANTRMKFPQVAADLRVRWCSSALKIEVGNRALRNQERFTNKRTLFITGERREESTNRARYKEFEPHTCHTKTRHVDHWRPVIDWAESHVWAAIRRNGIIAPLPYRLGWTRSSCMTCIFNGVDVWATILKHFPQRIIEIAKYELAFGLTIDRKGRNVIAQAQAGEAFEFIDPLDIAQATMDEYILPIVCEPDKWDLPAGAYSLVSSGAA